MLSRLIGKIELPAWPQISVVFLLTLFLVVVVVALVTNKESVSRASRLPLDD